MTHSPPPPTALPLEAAQVAALLREIGTRLELTGESPFKFRAYHTAAESLEALPTPLAEVLAQNRLRSLPGVGEALAEKILKLHKSGSHPTLEYLREQLPSGVLDLMQVQGLGPKKAMLLFNALKIDSLAALEDACRADKLAALKGFGVKLQSAFLKHLEQLKACSDKFLIDTAYARALAAEHALKDRVPGLKSVRIAGSVRRGCEVSDKITLAVSWDDALHPSGPGGPGGPDGLESSADFALVSAPEAHFGAALLFATGSETHWNQLCKLAESKGLSLSPNGLSRGSSDCVCDTEEAVYAALGLHYIEPELREGRGEIELASRGALPRLVCEADLRGILHCHTVFSDGRNSLAEMAEGARALGAHYFGVCDHSQSAAYAGGLKIEKVRAQHENADALNAHYKGANFQIFKGIESDILQDGALDYPASQLAQFDFIVASVHSRFQLSKKEQTARIVRAVENPFTTILGHPTGRLLLKREGYEVDLETVLAACAKHGVAVEINAHPQRLDLDWRWHARALELGCLFAINPDAHDVAGLQLQKWGVSVARKGGIPPERVLNCLERSEIAAHFTKRKLKG